MNKRLVTLIIEVLEKEKRRYACEANIEKQFQVNAPMHKRALKRYQELEQAIDKLSNLYINEIEK